MVKKLEYIDALRGLAMIGVLLNHFRPYGEFNPNPTTLETIAVNNGQGCIQLLYMISAFTLFVSYNIRRESERNYIRNFFIRRFFRIAPLYYFACIYYLIQHNLTLADTEAISNQSIVANFLLLHGFNPYWIHAIVPVGWSVGIEVQFYFILPILVRRIKNLNRAVIFLFCAILLNTILNIILAKTQLLVGDLPRETFAQFWLPNQLPAFASGIVLYFLITTPKPEWNVNPLIFAIAALAIFIDLASEKKLLYSEFTIYSLSLIAIVYLIAQRNYKIVINSATQMIGKINYGIYLFHYPVLGLMLKFDIVKKIESFFYYSSALGYIFSFSLFLVLNIIFSYALHHIIEIPFQKLGSRIIKKLQKNKAIPAVLHPDVLTT
ncbi:acyltransferase [Spirosoma sp. BT702]|uniref:Acyltransferase n=1 Tax=Spirosoma profusum TaxID=2771354 RepID=A0A927AQL3_9BACT|nr:acyltransferase [Spirosoma profusum]MBD2700706.1 acyltransferase [Spirosoma profusum]